jgi:hypothetical protein
MRSTARTPSWASICVRRPWGMSWRSPPDRHRALPHARRRGHRPLRTDDRPGYGGRRRGRHRPDRVTYRVPDVAALPHPDGSVERTSQPASRRSDVSRAQVARHGSTTSTPYSAEPPATPPATLRDPRPPPPPVTPPGSKQSADNSRRTPHRPAHRHGCTLKNRQVPQCVIRRHARGLPRAADQSPGHR